MTLGINQKVTSSYKLLVHYIIDLANKGLRLIRLEETNRKRLALNLRKPTST